MIFDRLKRRDLFSPGILNRLMGELIEEPESETASEQEHLHACIMQYFQSVESSYPILQEMPWEMLVAEARSLGIPIEGRAKIDIAREVLLRQSVRELEA